LSFSFKWKSVYQIKAELLLLLVMN
jgi:hypothetical protein